MEYQGGLDLKIESHWRKYRPTMVKQLERKGLLEESVRAVADLTSEALYHLVADNKMPLDQARELVMQEWAYLPSEEDQPELGTNPEAMIELAKRESEPPRAATA